MPKIKFSKKKGGRKVKRSGTSPTGESRRTVQRTERDERLSHVQEKKNDYILKQNQKKIARRKLEGGGKGPGPAKEVGQQKECRERAAFTAIEKVQQLRDHERTK